MSYCYVPDHFPHGPRHQPPRPRPMRTMTHCPHIPQYLRVLLPQAPLPLRVSAAEALPSSRQINNIQMPRQSLIFSIADFDLAYPNALDVAQQVQQGQFFIFGSFLCLFLRLIHRIVQIIWIWY